MGLFFVLHFASLGRGGLRTYMGQRADLYGRLLLCVWRKVADEWQKSLDYVRGSNIYVRGYLDLCTWSLRLRA